jgi:hypothetical protein
MISVFVPQGLNMVFGAAEAVTEGNGDVDAVVLQVNVDTVATGLVGGPQYVLVADSAENYVGVLDAALVWIKNAVVSNSWGNGYPQVDSVGGEWVVLSRARYGIEDDAWYGGYLNNLENYIKTYAASTDVTVSPHKVVLHSAKSTDNARVVLALSALGCDASNWRGYDLVSALTNTTYLPRQGLNGPVWALIALDTRGYHENDKVVRAFCLNYILEHEKTSGGWDLAGSITGTADPDITGMVLQSLAHYYKLGETGYNLLGLSNGPSYAEIRAVVERAVATLQKVQTGNGSFVSPFSGESVESVSQVLTALVSLGYDGTTDGSFMASALVNLLSFKDASTDGFRHLKSGNVDMMATEQAAYAMVAYTRYVKGQTALYDMSDLDLAVEDNKYTDITPNIEDINTDITPNNDSTDSLLANNNDTNSTSDIATVEEPKEPNVSSDNVPLKDDGNNSSQYLWLCVGGIFLLIVLLSVLIIFKRRKKM